MHGIEREELTALCCDLLKWVRRIRFSLTSFHMCNLNQCNRTILNPVLQICVHMSNKTLTGRCDNDKFQLQNGYCGFTKCRLVVIQPFLGVEMMETAKRLCCCKSFRKVIEQRFITMTIYRYLLVLERKTCGRQLHLAKRFGSKKDLLRPKSFAKRSCLQRVLHSRSNKYL